MRNRTTALAAGTVMLALGACTGQGDDSSAASSAPKAPKSEFTVSCPAFDNGDAGSKAGGLPALSLECLGSEGDPVGISGTPPHPTVVNLWASWCAPCRDEMPVIEQLAQAGQGAVDVLGIASSDSRTGATAFAIEFGMTFPSVLDPKGQVAASQGVPGLPATLFLDATGKVVDAHIGPYESYDELKQDVAEHLKVTL